MKERKIIKDFGKAKNMTVEVRMCVREREREREREGGKKNYVQRRGLRFDLEY